MKKPVYHSEWPESWKLSYSCDLLEQFGDTHNPGYTYAYQRRFNKVIESVKRYVPKHAHIIDIAAAQGNFSLRLAELDYIVTWNDLRSELADYVKLKYEAGEIHYLASNCFDLDLQEKFDAVLITEIIEHVAHPDQFLHRISTLVKPGGHIILTTPNGEYFANRLPKFSDCPDPSIFESLQFQPDADGHIFLLHRDEIAELVKQSGLILKELCLFNNLLTSGHMKTRYLLPIVPKIAIDRLEALTSASEGQFLPRINSQTLAVIAKP